MNFFEHQDRARRNTGRLVAIYLVAVVLIAVAVHVCFVTIFGFIESRQFDKAASIDPTLYGTPQPTFLESYLVPEVLLLTVGGTLLLIGVGTATKVMELRRGGGEYVAEMVGGRLLDRDSSKPNERRLLNVVDEMAIASGMPSPPIYIMDHEDGINAFAAGYAPDAAVIGVTQGAINSLSRDELQGVIAHEFSHIFNGDMRLNIRLLGVLHGILLIGLMGYGLVRMAAYSRYGRRSRDEGKAKLMMLVFGVFLIAIGAVGVFSGKLIKAAVSRQREFLADASAVQYTRLPDGIAGALKKIGGLHEGSQVGHAKAEELSHMFFGNAVGSFMGGALATHPPLPERIKRIQPNWDGEMPSVPRVRRKTDSKPSRHVGLMSKMEVVSGIGGHSRAARAGAMLHQQKAMEREAKRTAAKSPGQLRYDPSRPANTIAQKIALSRQAMLDSAGQLTPEHLSEAQAILEGIPALVRQACNTPLGGRAVVYLLLLAGSDEAMHPKQMDLIREKADPGVASLVEQMLPMRGELEPKARLPLLELCIPSLRELNPIEQAALLDTMEALIRADARVELWEWVIQRLVHKHLGAMAKGPRAGSGRLPLSRASSEISVLFSAMARVGSRDEAMVAQAFDAAMEAAALPGLRRKGKGALSLSALQSALGQLERLQFMGRRRVLDGCIAAVTRDGEVTLHEYELLRAIGESLDIPIPPGLSVD